MLNVSVPKMVFGWLKTERKLWILLGEFSIFVMSELFVYSF